jgi:hypothetical protein
MPSRRAPLIVGFFVVAASACVAPWDPPSGVVCEDGCSSTTTDPVPASTGELVPTTSTQDPGTTAGEPPGDTTGEPGSTTTQGDEGAVPTIVNFDVTPALMQDNGLIKISVSTIKRRRRAHAARDRRRDRAGPRTPGLLHREDRRLHRARQ